MSTTEAVQAVQIAIGVVSVLAALVGIAGALVAVFWRGAKFAEASAASVIESERRLVDKIAASVIEREQRLVDKIRESEQRLVDRITASEQRLRSENERAHAAIGTNLDRLSGDVRQLSGTLGSLANDVAFLSGRHHEGDLQGKGGHRPVAPA